MTVLAIQDPEEAPVGYNLQTRKGLPKIASQNNH
jgi:hypothetical protein